MFPKFICIGFQKCGTTTLYDIFRQHKDIILAKDVKEPMYYRVFGISRLFGGLKWYEKRYFSHVAENDPRLPGEINAGLAMTGCADKLGRDFPPETKLIFIMREPAARCFSAYKYFLARGFLPMKYIKYDIRNGHAEGFRKYIDDCLSSRHIMQNVMKKRLKYLCFSQNEYSASIAEYEKYFPRKNMHFVLFEDFIKNEKNCCTEICKFLGVPVYDNIDYNIKSNEGNLRAASPLYAKIGWAFTGLYYLLFEFFDMQRTAPKIYARFDRFYQRIMNNCMIPDSDHSKPFPETLDKLKEHYKDEVAAVEKILGRRLSGIWY